MPNKTALITGASTGIGVGLAQILAQNGFNLILMARRENLLHDVRAEVLQKHPDCQVHVVASDVSQFDQHIEDIKQACANVQSLDLVIANAGVGYPTDEATNTWENNKKTFDINLLGAIATMEAAKDVMLKQGSGQIVGISSLAALRGLPMTSSYCASKAGLSTFMESMRIDLKAKNIFVTAVHPGFIETPMTAKNNGYMPGLMSVEKASRIIFKAIQKKKARLYFPWQMSWSIKLMRAMPDRLFDFIMGMSRKKAEKFKKNRAS